MTFTYENDEQLQEALIFWQKVLRLQDWDVYARIARGRELFTENSAAAVRWTLAKKVATLQLLDPIDYEDNLAVEQDHEVSLVHELLHLHYAPFDNTEDDSLELYTLEQSIEAISRALVDLKRKAALDK
jgi:hypothetical protein